MILYIEDDGTIYQGVGIEEDSATEFAELASGSLRAIRFNSETERFEQIDEAGRCTEVPWTFRT